MKFEKPKRKSLILAIAFAAIWLILIGVMWLVYIKGESEEGGFLNFIARFHILIVHIPIGVIFLGALMEVLSRFKQFSALAPTLPFIHWIAFIGAIGATLVGYLLMGIEDYKGLNMTIHLYFGLAVVVTTFFSVLFAITEKRLLSTLFVFASVGTASISGHFGGNLVHGKDYLTEYAPGPIKPLIDMPAITRLFGGGKEPEQVNPNAGVDENGDPVEVPLQDQTVYHAVIAPIMSEKCNYCHDADKIKGDLRTDTLAHLLASDTSSGNPAVVPGDVDASEMIFRITLDLDDDDFMPPQPKGTPMTPEEIEVVSLWIEKGATDTIKVSELGDFATLEPKLLAIQAGLEGDDEGESASDSGGVNEALAAATAAWDALPPEEQKARVAKAISDADAINASVTYISAEDSRLRVNVINAAKNFGDEQLKILEPVASQVLWLDLGRSQVTDAGMDTIATMAGLERLHLGNTQVTDEGIAKLKPLKELTYLNLYGSQVGDGIFETFQSLPKLRNVYAWQTKVTKGAASNYERSVNLQINTGSELETVAAPDAEAEAEEGEKDEAKDAEKTDEKKADSKQSAKKDDKAEAKETPANAKKAKKQNAGKNKAPAKEAVDKAEAKTEEAVEAPKQKANKQAAAASQEAKKAATEAKQSAEKAADTAKKEATKAADTAKEAGDAAKEKAAENAKKAVKKAGKAKAAGVKEVQEAAKQANDAAKKATKVVIDPAEAVNAQ